MPYEFGKKIKKTPGQIKEGATRKAAFKLKTAKPKSRGPKRSVAY